MKVYRAIGLMSGTSLDGIDVAMIYTDGEKLVEPRRFLSVPYDDALRSQLRACFGAPDHGPVKEATRALTLAHVEAVQTFMTQNGLDVGQVDLIGFHGQTIYHAPEKGVTCQIGDGALLSSMTGIPVVNDFRSKDVAAGGQGAPLAPIYHQALAAEMEKPVVFLNIGGVANVTYVGDSELLAFDTGPGNALIDDWILAKTGKRYDDGGALALSGKVDESILSQLLAHPFFARKPPKSLDRDAFVSKLWSGLSAADGAATLSAFTVRAVAAAAQHFPQAPAPWIVCGGGRHNVYLMGQLQRHINAPVLPIEEVGWNGDATEAEAFAYLAVRSLRGLPISFPGTTGAPTPMMGGRVSP